MMCKSYNRQYGTNFISCMPTNWYGPGDNYRAQDSHVLPALIRRFHEAKHHSDNVVTILGSGTPRKLLDCTKINALGWKASTPIKEGVAKAYDDFQRRLLDGTLKV
jgi:nucleoside-diphosphate-sugar epimerase